MRMADLASTESMLAQVDLFSGMSKRNLRKLTRLCHLAEHPAGHTIAAEGLGALAFHLVLTGEASVQRGGREVARLGPGSYFGEISMIDGKPRSASVIAVEPLTTMALHRSDFLALLESEPSVVRTILNGLCARIREADARP
jgi:CRP/FNR family cyclic AMP-dependent transcriptional regulator